MNTPHGPVRREQGLRNSGAAGPHVTERPRSQTERARIEEQLRETCFWHGFEPNQPSDYWWCGECGHVWRTREAFDADVALLDGKVSRFSEEEIVTDPRTLDYCPLCAHDW